MSLCKKYRPAKLSQMYGNNALIKAIGAHFKKKDHNHAMLIYGASGCGKTTLARAISKEILECDEGCINEINASTFNGVDDMRKIEQSLRYPPILGKYAVYIIDECQNLTPAAKSALLKPCEDMPPYVYFFFCTTNKEKFFKGDKGEKTSALTTRLTQWMVEPLDTRAATELLCSVCQCENFCLTQAVGNRILEVSEGSPRSLLVNLEKVIGCGSEADALELLKGSVGIDNVSEEVQQLGKTICLGNNMNEALALVKTIKASGKEEPVSLAKMIMAFASGCLLNRGFQERPAAALQNFAKHYENVTDSGWHIFTLAVIETFA